jgi:hypothetical protein
MVVAGLLDRRRIDVDHLAVFTRVSQGMLGQARRGTPSAALPDGANTYDRVSGRLVRRLHHSRTATAASSLRHFKTRGKRLGYEFPGDLPTVHPPRAAGSRQPICSARATMMPAGPRR